MIYYFTYGSDDRFPFQSGWTEVEAESYDQAVEAFQAFHPNRPGSDFINCAGIYGEEIFSRKRMAKEQVRRADPRQQHQEHQDHR